MKRSLTYPNHARDRLTETTHPDGGRRFHANDSKGKRNPVTSPNGVVTE
jgi:hypothetical protein